MRDLGSGESGGGISIVNFVERVARKLRRIVLFRFGLMNFMIHFRETRKPIIFMVFGPSGCDHDSQNQLFFILETPNALK